ncbi:hypothetical protein SO802_032341 [Lithocarpus litseifolius]|uniref:Reverse transcriptase zinc-binding domain-containing protein n=1 Tax=Lithocarpus litseifolius TaxID=425828 RepID=A0AAW2BTL5_9ROSI
MYSGGPKTRRNRRHIAAVFAPAAIALTQDDVCEECGVAVESLSHLFWHCVRAQEVWKASNLGLEADLVEIHEFIDLALARLFMTAWGIWSNRNEIRTGGSR